MPYWSGLGLLIFAGMSFFFALAESALFSLGQWRVRQLTERSPGTGAQGHHGNHRHQLWNVHIFIIT